MSDTAIKSSSIRNLIKANIRNYSMVLMLALIMIIFAFLTDGVNLNSRNFTNIFMQNSYILLLAVGMVLVIIVGNIDLSVGSVAAFIGAISAMLYNSGANMLVTIVASIIIGVLIGAFQGVWIAYAKIPAFIVTLAAQLLFRGLTYIITNVSPISLRDDNFKQIASGMANIDALTINGVYYTALVAGIVVFLIYAIFEFQGRQNKLKYGFRVSPLSFFIIKLLVIGLLIMGLAQRFSTYRGIPIVVIVLGVTIILFSFITNNTVIGRYIYAVGGNARSAKLSGINSELVVFVVQLIMGGLTGLAGVVFTGYMNSALPQAGNNFELDAIAACFIGGASASGGIGTVIGAIVGGLVMAAINNGMSLMNIQAQWQYVVKALVLLLAVFYDIYTRRKTGLG
ncbi:multiple monosaccharide ABC transporter permease [Gracilinema caldarium]|uniref:multiple monosaccharide ABC transporter permease n=1 Tax=Gracilinema caldarium TaxID=215591 RepID=UPI0026EDD17F|nr:multiple monosaccharide ABC transporter permease [Gracilinema caldarium]